METVKHIWTRTKDAGIWIAGGLLLLVGAGWAWNRRTKQLGEVRDQLAVTQATSEIGKLRAVRERVIREVAADDQAVVEIDRALAENRRAVIEAHEGGEGLSDEEVEREFARLGY